MDVMKSYLDARHACSPACLAVLGDRLAAMDDALQPVEVSGP